MIKFSFFVCSMYLVYRNILKEFIAKKENQNSIDMSFNKYRVLANLWSPKIVKRNLR